MEKRQKTDEKVVMADDHPVQGKPGEPTDEHAGAVESDIRAELEQAKAESAERWDQLVRSRAELENLRKRMQRDVENAHKYAVEKFAGDLLSVRDSLEMGLDAARGGAELSRIIEGTELTLKLLEQTMAKHGVQELDPTGQRFDPDRHQAMSLQENGEMAPNTVMAVMQKGYLLNDRLLRPAMVIVSKLPPAASAAAPGPGDA